MDSDDTGQDGLAALIDACEAADAEFDAEANGDTPEQIDHGIYSAGELQLQTRPETGPMVFGDDWPGVFIRGDNAAHFAWHLASLLKRESTDGIERMVLEGLSNALVGSRVVDGEQPSKTQELRPYVECLAIADMSSLKEMERKHILRVLEFVHGNKTQACKVLGLDRRTLYRRLHSYGVM